MKKKVLFFILLLVAGLALFSWLAADLKTIAFTPEEKSEALKKLLGRPARESPPPILGEAPHTGQFFSLSYPGYASLYNKDNPNITANPRLLEALRLDSESPRFRFVVMVESADGIWSLDDLPGVRTRQKDVLYGQSPITVDGIGGLLFTKTSEGVERTSFLLTGGKTYSFSITGVDEKELEKIYTQIIESVRIFSSR